LEISCPLGLVKLHKAELFGAGSIRPSFIPPVDITVESGDEHHSHVLILSL